MKKTEATEHFLRPVTLDKIGDAILEVSLAPNEKHFVVEIYEKHKTQLYDDVTESYREAEELCSPYKTAALRFVEQRFKHGHRAISRKGTYHPIYEVPISDITVNLVMNAWPKESRIIRDSAMKKFTELYLREFSADQNALRTAQFKEQGVVPTADWFEQHDKFLYEHGIEFTGEPIILSAFQKTAAFNCCMSKAYAYLCDPGLGKTCMMIRKLDYLLYKHESSGQERKVLILICCPKSVRANWQNELRKFSQYHDKLAIIPLQGNNALNRFLNFSDAIIASEGKKHIVVLTGYESFVQTPMLHELEWDLCLFDEMHNLANPSTKRTKTFLSLRNKFHHRVGATGTFFRNSPFDGFAQLEFLETGLSGFDSMNAYKQFFGLYGEPTAYNGHSRLEGFQNIPLLQERLAKHTFIITKEEAMPHMPKKTFSIAECSLSKDQLKVYLQLANQLAAEIESYGPNPDTITVNNILTQMLRLAQVTSGFAATDQGTISRFDPNPKLDLLVSLLTGKQLEQDDETGSSADIGVLTNPNSKAIVWCAFKENLKMIHVRLALEGIRSVTFHGSSEDKPGIIEEFNCDPECRVFIGIAQSGGVGLNLVGFDPNRPNDYKTNTENVYFYSSNWSSVNRQQAADRAHRHNTRVPIHITDLLVPQSIDFEIYDRVLAKIEMSREITDVRKILSGLLSNIPQVNGG